MRVRGRSAFPCVIVSAVLAVGFMAGLVGVDNSITEGNGSGGRVKSKERNDSPQLI